MRKMNKGAMALAIASALAAPAVAFAQGGKPPERAAGLEQLGGGSKDEFVIYGRANLGLDMYQATGATAGASADFARRTRVYDAASRLGFRGTELLGDGYKATFLIESGVNMDTGTQASQSGATNISTGFLGSRIANLSFITPDVGQVSFGRTNVWWSNGTIEQTGANYVNSSSILSGGTFGRGMGVGVSRVNNLFQYITPVFPYATYATFSFSPLGEAQTAGNNVDGKLYAVSVEGSSPLNLDWGVDLTKVWGNTIGSSGIATAIPAQVNVGGTGITVPGLAAGSLANKQQTTVGQKLRFGYWYAPGVGKVAVIWLKSTLDYGGAYGGLSSNPDPTAPELTQTAWMLSWEHMLPGGRIQGLAQYGKALNVKGCVTARACDNTNATQYMVGARYLFSKRTWMYITYNATVNAANYNLDYIPGGLTSATAGGTTLSGAGGLPTGSVGADPRIFAVGMQHRF